MAVQTIYESIKNTIPPLETLSQKVKLPDWNIMEVLKKQKNKILFGVSAISIGALTMGICYQIRLIRYRRLCMEMAKIDHDIAVYVAESSSLYTKKAVSLRPEKKDIQYRYRLYKQLNRGKSFSSIQNDLNELKARRVREAHEFNFDLMCLRHQMNEK